MGDHIADRRVLEEPHICEMWGQAQALRNQYKVSVAALLLGALAMICVLHIEDPAKHEAVSSPVLLAAPPESALWGAETSTDTTASDSWHHPPPSPPALP